MICCCKSKQQSSLSLKPQLTFRVYKQRILFNNTYQLSVFPTYFEIGNKHKIDFQLTSHIGIKYSNTTNKPIGIKIQENFKEHLYIGDSMMLEQFLFIIDSRLSFSRIMDHYQPMALIGRGSSSEVFIIQEVFSKLQFASKSILKSYLLTHPFGQEAFQQEVDILRQLSKLPNFMKIYSIYDSNSSYYIILEYFQGLTLEQHMLMKKQRNLWYTLDEKINIMKQLLTLINEMHKQNIMHRDLKPANIMFEQQDSIKLKIIDFGLAQIISKEMLFKRCGTAGYVAPEVFRNYSYNEACDVFSLGCIFYKILTGNSLFKGKSTEEILMNNKKCRFILDVPEYACHFLNGMLRLEPNTRLTAEECLEHSFFGGDVTDRQNFENIDERSQLEIVPDSYQPEIYHKITALSHKTISSQTSLKTQKTFYIKKSMNGLQKFKI